MRELLIATTNPGKFNEISEVLGDLNLKLFFLGDLDIDGSDFVEDGIDFKENAYKKAVYFSEKIGLPALGEDSGILVSALSGELGVKTRRWGAGEEASDEEWIGYFLKRMSGEEDRRAKFICWSCVYGLDSIINDQLSMVNEGGDREFEEFDGLEGGKFFKGETNGIITDRLMAPILKGLPLSSCFMPEGCDKVYAVLGADWKNEISHRGKALMKAKRYLEGV